MESARAVEQARGLCGSAAGWHLGLGTYLHNGSVPTLWHLFHSDARRSYWQRSEDGYDQHRVGLEVTAFDDCRPRPKTPRKGAAISTRVYPAKAPQAILFLTI